ncbi:tetratricopeptide repeat protein [Streptomyces sp. NPDC002018]|uniref:tetratricopeptide repeat protein n=1 Tax=Streptomyces sp. NPDC002018 TaxID=3364629 RepID=UPI0036C82A31
MDIALTLRDHRLEGYWLLTLGDAQQANGEPAEALASYQRSAALHRRLGNRSREAMAWNSTADAYRRLGRHEEAAQFHRRAAAVHHELGDTWDEAMALDGLAEALAAEEPQAALGHWADALRLLAGYDDPRAVAARERMESRRAETC